MSRLNVDIGTARKNLGSHDWVAVDMHDSLCKKCRGSILNVSLVFSCNELSDKFLNNDVPDTQVSRSL